MPSVQPVGVVPPPPGVTPNFVNPERKYWTANHAIVITGLGISTSFLAMRLFTKIHVQRNFGFDDASIVVAWMFSLGTECLALYGYHHAGVGVHVWNLTVGTFDRYQKVVLAAAIIYIPALSFAKVALLVLYHRLARQKAFRWALYTIGFIVCASSFSLICAYIFGCHPIEKSWNPAITTGSCINRASLFLATAIINIITDFFLILIPIPIVWGLKMPRIQKLGLMGMFVIGSATIVTSIIRLVTLVPLLHTTDQPHGLGWANLWVNIEANFIIICNCLPTLRQFLRRYAPKFIGEGSSRGRSNPTDPRKNSSAGYSSNRAARRFAYNRSLSFSDNPIKSFRSKHSRLPDDTASTSEDVELAQGLGKYGKAGATVTTWQEGGDLALRGAGDGDWDARVMRKGSSRSEDDNSEKAIIDPHSQHVLDGVDGSVMSVAPVLPAQGERGMNGGTGRAL